MIILAMQVPKPSLLWFFSVGISTFLPCSCRILLFYAHQVLRKACLTYLLQVNHHSVSSIQCPVCSCFLCHCLQHFKGLEVFGLSLWRFFCSCCKAACNLFKRYHCSSVGGWLIFGRFTEYSPCPPLILKISCGVVVLLKTAPVLQSVDALMERSLSCVL